VAGSAGAGTISFQPSGFSHNRVSGESYDCNNNLTNDGVNAYSWDAGERGSGTCEKMCFGRRGVGVMVGVE